jgi:hypothetical protein
VEGGRPADPKAHHLTSHSPWLALGVAWAALLVALWWPWDVDDAFILFRYGRHLAHGHGLAWNPGGPPVEGYTNLVFVVFSAGLLPLGVDPLVPVKVLGVISYGAMVWLVGRLARVVGGSPTEATLARLALLFTPGLALWSVAGLETTFFVPIDWGMASGDEVPLEARDATEVTHVSGLDDAGLLRRVRLTAEGTPVHNPGFDVTPARLVSALITEAGVCQASTAGLRGLFPEAAP